MTAAVLPFPPQSRTREMEAWDLYCEALTRLQDMHPAYDVEAMRAVVDAYDRWRVEYRKVVGL